MSGRKGQLRTLPVVTEHMNDLLRLPDAEQQACMACTSYAFTRSSPAPTLPPLAGAQKVGRTFFGTVEMDTFQAAAALLRRGWQNPTVLNMANEYNCGGAWCQKPGSQEEDLLRCSSLPLCLWPRRLPKDYRMPEFDHLLPRVETIYPFAEAGAVYSPHVRVCRSRGGQLLPAAQHFNVSVVSSAAQDLRQNRAHYAGPFDRRLTIEKMRSMLWVAAHHGHRELVLGAYGCGAFKHDPARIADLFRQILGAGGEYEGRFDVVIFAVIKSEHNLQAFGSLFPWVQDPPLRPMPTVAAAPLQAASSALTDCEKEVLKLAKKLRECLKLEEDSTSGDQLAQNQQLKVAKKGEWLHQFLGCLASVPSDSGVPAKVHDVVDKMKVLDVVDKMPMMSLQGQ